MVHTFNSSTQVDLHEFKVSLVYRSSSRTARTTQRNPYLKNKNKQTNNKMSSKTKLHSFEGRVVQQLTSSGQDW